MPVPVLTGAQTQLVGTVAGLIPQLKQLRVDDPHSLQRALDSIRNTIDQILRHPLIDCRMLTVKIPNPPKPVTLQHGLGRIPIGFVTIQPSSGLTFSVVGGDAQPKMSTTVRPQGGSGTATLLIF